MTAGRMKTLSGYIYVLMVIFVVVDFFRGDINTMILHGFIATWNLIVYLHNE